MQEAKFSNSGYRQNRNQGPRPLTFNTLNTLSEVKLDRSVLVILQQLGATLRVEIDMAGQAIARVHANGRVLCSLEELSRLGTVRRYLTQISKDKVFEEELPAIQVILINSAKLRREADGKPLRLPKITPKLIADVKALKRTIDILSENQAALEQAEAENTLDLGIKEVLRKAAILMRLSHARVILACTAGQKMKGLLSAQYEELGVPRYLARLLVGKGRIGNGPIRSLLFGRNLTKSISLTLREWRSPQHIQLVEPLLERSRGLMKLISNDDFLVRVARPHRLDLNSGDQLALRVLQIGVGIIPPITPEEWLYPRATGKTLDFPTVPRPGPVGAIRHVFQGLTRTYAGEVLLTNAVEDFFTVVFPSTAGMYTGLESYKPLISVVYDALADQQVAQEAEDYMYLRTKEAVEGFKRLLAASVPQHTDEAYAALFAQAKLSDETKAEVDGEDPTTVGEPEDLDLWEKLCTPLADSDPVVNFRSTKGKKTRKKRTVIRATALSKTSKKLLARIKKSRYTDLEGQIGEWLSGFVSPEVQEIAAANLKLQLTEGTFSSEFILDSEDESLVSSDDPEDEKGGF